MAHHKQVSQPEIHVVPPQTHKNNLFESDLLKQALSAQMNQMQQNPSQHVAQDEPNLDYFDNEDEHNDPNKGSSVLKKSHESRKVEEND